MVRTNKIYEMENTKLASKSNIKFSNAPISTIRQPNAVIEFYFKKKLALNYNYEEKIRLIDYISELCLYYPKKTSIETISTATSQRWLKEEKGTRAWDLEDYISFIFEEHSKTPEELMEYILEENWAFFEKKINSRQKKEKEGWKQCIKREVETLKNKLALPDKYIELQNIRQKIEQHKFELQNIRQEVEQHKLID